MILAARWKLNELVSPIGVSESGKNIRNVQKPPWFTPQAQIEMPATGVVAVHTIELREKICPSKRELGHAPPD